MTAKGGFLKIMPVPSDLTHFQPAEFKHPELMETTFVRWLDRVRDRAAVPMVLTDDGRLPDAPNPTGSAGKHSLHMRGRAVDIRSRDWTAAEKWKVAAAIIALASEAPGCVEWEAVYSGTDRHWHLGVNDQATAHTLIEADE